MALAGIVVVAVAAAYVYDSARSERIASGVRVAGVYVGGRSASEARGLLLRRFDRERRSRIVVRWRRKRFSLYPRRVRLAADVDGMVREAVERSRRGNLFSRTLRDITGGRVNVDLPARISYSHGALARFVARLRRAIDRRARNADIAFTGSRLRELRGRDALAVETPKLTRSLQRALLDPASSGAVRAPVRSTPPAVTRRDLPARYPRVIGVNRDAKQLYFFRRLRVGKRYVIAVGRQGLVTPAGRHQVLDKEVNPAWHVPNSAWAGRLAGRVIPPGPEDPLKARWIGFYDGSGIHGTDDLASLGTAASHGCIRMSIPEVIQLYRRVRIGDPVFVK